MDGLSKRFLFTALGVVAMVFAALYGVHLMTSEPEDGNQADIEHRDSRSARRSESRASAATSRSSRASPASRTIAKNADEVVILDAAKKARDVVAEQHKARRERMAPMMEKRREFFASLQNVEDDEERKRMMSEWRETQRAEMVALRETESTETDLSAQRLAGMETKLNFLRRYDLVPDLKPKADELRTLMAEYARQSDGADESTAKNLWNQIEQGMQNLRREHMQLMHPERFK